MPRAPKGNRLPKTDPELGKYKTVDSDDRDPNARVNLTFRIPERMRKQLEEAAIFNDLSLNAEITRRIELSLNSQNVQTSDEISNYAKMIRDLGRLAEKTIELHGGDADERLQVLAAIVAYMQGLAGMPADKLLRAAFESGAAWRDAAMRLLAFTQNIEHPAALLLVNPDDKGAVVQGHGAAGTATEIMSAVHNRDAPSAKSE